MNAPPQSSGNGGPDDRGSRPGRTVPENRQADPEDSVQEGPAQTGGPRPDEPRPATAPDQRPATDGTDGSGGGPATRGTWRSLLAPRFTLGHVAVALLCAGLGFAVVTQVRQTQDDVLAGMRQDDLVRLLDELTQRNADLSDEQEELRRDLAELRSSSTSREAAQEAAEVQARTRGILAGTLPVHGPGVRVVIDDPGGGVRAQVLVTILEELRNAGVESVELSGQRLTASSWILDDRGGGVVVDGVSLDPPYEWLAIGDPDTLSGALDIPGGALSSVRNAGGEVTGTEEDDVRITTTREVPEPEHATPVAPEEPEG